MTTVADPTIGTLCFFNKNEAMEKVKYLLPLKKLWSQIFTLGGNGI
jgi:hypothetical protein